MTCTFGIEDVLMLAYTHIFTGLGVDIILPILFCSFYGLLKYIFR